MPNLPLLMHARLWLEIPGDFRLRVGLFLPLHLILWAIGLCRDVGFVGVWCTSGNPVYRIRRALEGFMDDIGVFYFSWRFYSRLVSVPRSIVHQPFLFYFFQDILDSIGLLSSVFSLL
jgi:hypothetical protein